jgi:hypothetical protein
MAETGELVAQVLLERGREQASAEDVSIPKTPVFDEQPAVDPARGCSERFVRVLGKIRTEASFQADRHNASVAVCKGCLTSSPRQGRRERDAAIGGGRTCGERAHAEVVRGAAAQPADDRRG